MAGSIITSRIRRFKTIGGIVGVAFIAILFLASCASSGGSGGDDDDDASKKTVRVSWTANRETAVNTTGGGYKVYYNSLPNFSTSAATTVDVPYTSGDSSPTYTDIELAAGTYYFRIAAYSALNTGGSEESTEISLTVSP